MLLTKAQTRSQIAKAIDDPKLVRWPSADLDDLTSLVQDLIWQTILDTFNTFTLFDESKATDGSGKIAISSLTKRLFQFQRVAVASTDEEVFAIQSTDSLDIKGYYLSSSTLYTKPVQSAKTLTLSYSFFPTKFRDLGESDQLDSWPEGFESGLIYPTAAVALSKGSAEDMTQVAALADWALNGLANHVNRMAKITNSSQQPKVSFAPLRNLIIGANDKQG